MKGRINLSEEDKRDLLLLMEDTPGYELLGEIEKVVDVLVIMYPDYEFDYWEMHDVIQAAEDYMDDQYARQEDDEEIDWATHDISEFDY